MRLFTAFVFLLLTFSFLSASSLESSIPALASDGFSLQESGFNPPNNLPTFNLENEQSPVAAFERILLNYIINPIFLISGGVAVVVILYSSFRLVSSRAQEDAITAAKTTLIWAFVGLGLIMLAYTIVSNLARIILEQL